MMTRRSRYTEGAVRKRLVLYADELDMFSCCSRLDSRVEPCWATASTSAISRIVTSWKACIVGRLESPQLQRRRLTWIDGRGHCVLSSLFGLWHLQVEFRTSE